MNNYTLPGEEQAKELAQGYMSPRYRRLDGLEKWATGTQYKDRKNWWDDSVPLWERAPCIVYPVVDVASKSNTDLCLGEGRFPSFEIAHSGKKSAKSGKEATESDGENDPLDEALKHYHKVIRFPTVCREAMDTAQTCGTVVALHGARNGKPFMELIPAKWCEAKEGEDGELEELEIFYSYLETYKRSDRRWAVRAMLYRRVIDRKSDTVYKPAEAQQDGVGIDWQVDAAKTEKHNFAFVPAVWYAFQKGCQPVNEVDGRAIHTWITDEIHQHDIARSQWHRGALLSEPQIWETGVIPGTSPTGTGRKPLIQSTETGGPITPDNPPNGGYQVHETGGTGEARKKGPGHVWQYESKDSKVGVLNYPGDALKAQQDNVSDLRLKIQESLAVVFLDPENIKFAATTSGKALKQIKQKQFDRCGQYREDFRDGFLEPNIRMQLRILAHFGEALSLPGAEAVKGLLAEQGEAEALIETSYGDFTELDTEERAALVKLIAMAMEKNLITHEQAVKQVAPLFGIKDIDKLLEELEKERTERESELEAWSLKNDPGAVSKTPQKVPTGSPGGRPSNGQNDPSGNRNRSAGRRN